MPNATCFLIAYGLVFCLELARWIGLSPAGKSLLMKLLIAMTAIALTTHTLYLMDRVFLSAVAKSPWRLVSSWHDWGVLSAWTLAIAYGTLLLRRSESWIGLFVLPLLLILISASLAVPKDPLGDATSATIWRFAHGVAMMLGTMLVTLGFAMAIMYLIQAWRLKSKRSNQVVLKLPSLEYLQSFGSVCLLLSAASIGFGVVSGVIMNLVQDGQVDWTEGGILFSGGLFIWLSIASAIQWHFARQGKGHITAWMNILSFLIVAVAIALVVSAPHGSVDSSSKTNRQSRVHDVIGGAF
jgi:hypothetical protein